MAHSAFAPGKIILSGEYAVVFGKPAIAVPSSLGITCTLEEGKSEILWEGATKEWLTYAQSIVNLYKIKNVILSSPASRPSIRPPLRLRSTQGDIAGRIEVHHTLPLGKGMGSSTALVIALGRLLLGNDEEAIRKIEDAVNPGHSGLDFAVIWNEKPLLFQKGKAPKPVTIDLSFMNQSVLIDTGAPAETTADLVAWMQSRPPEDIEPFIEKIGECTQRLADGESPSAVFPDHHRAQVALGVVPPQVQQMIAVHETPVMIREMITNRFRCL